jgi:hypothetical protein
MANTANAKVLFALSSINVKELKAERSLGCSVTLRHAASDNLVLRLAVTDATLADVNALNGAVVYADYNLNSETKLKGAYGEGPCTKLTGTPRAPCTQPGSPTQIWARRAWRMAWSGTVPSTAAAPASRWARVWARRRWAWL